MQVLRLKPIQQMTWSVVASLLLLLRRGRGRGRGCCIKESRDGSNQSPSQSPSRCVDDALVGGDDGDGARIDGGCAYANWMWMREEEEEEEGMMMMVVGWWSSSWMWLQ